MGTSIIDREGNRIDNAGMIGNGSLYTFCTYHTTEGGNTRFQATVKDEFCSQITKFHGIKLPYLPHTQWKPSVFECSKHCTVNSRLGYLTIEILGANKACAEEL